LKSRQTKTKNETKQVDDYVFKDWNNKDVKLSNLFGSKEDLILVHNMGKKCSHCTMWADGFNGVVDHLQDRAAFVVVSPDSPETQKVFATSRGWKFKMLSTKDSPFNKDMGFETNNEAGPGVSVFQKTGQGKILRVAKDEFGPGDPYCIVWHFFDLLPKGDNGWLPKFKYEK
jgi:predicted dithiol-disulfide oxidoreductase (DUF899 family)